MSEQFYCCVFSYVDLELPPVQLRLHGLVVVYGASVLTDCIDRLTSLVDRSSCDPHLSIVSSNGRCAFLGTYRSSLATADILLQLFVLLLCHLVNDFLLMPQLSIQ